MGLNTAQILTIPKYNSSHSPTKWVAVKSGATPTVKIASDLYGAYGFTKTSFSTKYLDSQRTIGLTIKGTVKIQPFKGSSYSVSEITVYTEYAYAS